MRMQWAVLVRRGSEAMLTMIAMAVVGRCVDDGSPVLQNGNVQERTFLPEQRCCHRDCSGTPGGIHARPSQPRRSLSSRTARWWELRRKRRAGVASKRSTPCTSYTTAQKHNPFERVGIGTQCCLWPRMCGMDERAVFGMQRCVRMHRTECPGCVWCLLHDLSL